MNEKFMEKLGLLIFITSLCILTALLILGTENANDATRLNTIHRSLISFVVGAIVYLFLNNGKRKS